MKKIIAIVCFWLFAFSAQAEEGKIAVRKVRQESNEALKKEEKDSNITEDDLHRERDEIQKLTDRFCTQIDTVVDAKQKEIMEL